jgi:putative membrane-bound dehydrogenase-like protein
MKRSVLSAVSFLMLVVSLPTVASAQIRDAKKALAALDVGEGLEATLFASEPLLLSPSNIDIDHRGRVWVCEVVNYRKFANKNNPFREEGDRILILEDTNGDGKADTKKVFYQGRDIDSAHGVCVLGNRVIVSALDKVLVLTDTDGDDKADKKNVLFSGIAGSQHDHGIHSFLFGPDGRLYFNFGNAGHTLKDSSGKPVTDRSGNLVAMHRKPYQEGLLFRCNLDGSDLETLGWNFRNNWEAAVDSFGGLWQSDNDDDGNRGVRINAVFEYGNYGYKDEITGAGWKNPRTGMHTEIPKRHWHLNDPGVVPNLLQTGAGSPTGIIVYEGRLLPKRFWNQIIHCDAGPNVVRAYPTKKSGAGYTATIDNVLQGTRDKWFRPSDVCTAPDGSIIIADWYDPGVGGHRMGDIQHGRLFRITPKGHKGYKQPKFDFKTADGAANALTNPNLAARHLAWTALNKMGAKAERALLQLNMNENPRIRARALWLLANISQRGMQTVERAIVDSNPDIRMTGLRIARRLKLDVVAVIEKLIDDKSPQVRRECAIALRYIDSAVVPSLWSRLAAQYDGKDRWYLEALGIGAGDRWDECVRAWLERVDGKTDTPAARDILWRSRTAQAIPSLTRFILDPMTTAEQRLRYFRAFDFHSAGPEKSKALVTLLVASHKEQATITALALKHGAKVDLKDPVIKAAIDRSLDVSRGTAQFISLVATLNLTARYPDLLAIAVSKPDEQLGVEAVRALLAKGQQPLVRRSLQQKDEQLAAATATVLGNSADGRALGLLRSTMNDVKRPIAVRRASVGSMSKIRNGALELVKLVGAKKLDQNLIQAAAVGLQGAQWRDVKEQAGKLFPPPPGKSNKPLPPIDQLVARRGNVVKGRLVFNTTGTCAKCHVVNNLGKNVGPNLSEIGKKLSRQAFFHSILYPNAGISHSFETWVLVTDSGTQVSGLLTSRTDEAVTVTGADGIARTFKAGEIEVLKKQNISLMPADLQKTMTAAELVDVVEYLTTLKVAKKKLKK